jgi:large subunit ribosomal protein L25
MNQPNLSATARTVSTKGALNTLRKQGVIPAVVYGRDREPMAISINEKEFQKAIAGVSESTIVKLNIGGSTFDTFIKERQRDWLKKGRVTHIDFMAIDASKTLRMKVPVHLVGSAVGVREGGILEHAVHEIEVECVAREMPERIEVDVSDLHANHAIHVRELKIPQGVKVHASPEQVVVTVKYAKAEAAVEAPEAAAPEAAAAAPAAAEEKK